MGYRSNFAAPARTAALEPGPGLSGDARAPAEPSGEPNRRRHYRQKVRNLAYIIWDPDHRGVLRDLSKSGGAVQGIVPLHIDEQIHFRLDLSNPRTRVEGRGRVVWSDPLGQAGI